MADIKCTNCGKSYDDEFDICPHCGSIRQEKSKKKSRLRIIIPVIVAVLIIAAGACVYYFMFLTPRKVAKMPVWYSYGDNYADYYMENGELVAEFYTSTGFLIKNIYNKKGELRERSEESVSDSQKTLRQIVYKKNNVSEEHVYNDDKHARSHYYTFDNFRRVQKIQTEVSTDYEYNKMSEVFEYDEQGKISKFIFKDEGKIIGEEGEQEYKEELIIPISYAKINDGYVGLIEKDSIKYTTNLENLGDNVEYDTEVYDRYWFFNDSDFAQSIEEELEAQSADSEDELYIYGGEGLYCNYPLVYSVENDDTVRLVEKYTGIYRGVFDWGYIPLAFYKNGVVKKRMLGFLGAILTAVVLDETGKELSETGKLFLSDDEEMETIYQASYRYITHAEAFELAKGKKKPKRTPVEDSYDSSSNDSSPDSASNNGTEQTQSNHNNEVNYEVVSLNADQQYEANIFISNFTEQEEITYYDANNYDIKEIAKFAYRYGKLNEPANISTNMGYDTFSDVFLNKVTDRFLGKSFSPSDLSLIPGFAVEQYSATPYYDNGIIYMQPSNISITRFAVVEEARRFANGMYEMIFAIVEPVYGSVNYDCYALTIEEINESDAFKKIGSGKAHVHPKDYNGRSTYWLSYYEVD